MRSTQDTAPIDWAPPAGASCRIADVAVLTCNRPAALARALDSYIAHAQRHARRGVAFTVFDDSADAAVQAQNRQLAAEAGRHGATSYVGIAERGRFAARLVEAGCPADVVQFALFGSAWHGLTVGANRNAAILETAGRPVLFVDDDTECTPVLSPAVTAGAVRVRRGPADQDPVFPCRLWVRDSHDPRATWPEADHDLDVLDLHERLLGRHVRDIAFAGDEGGSPGEAAPVEPARVVVTLNGLLGDCGWQSPTQYLWLTREPFESLARSEAEYRAACCTREVLRVADRVVVADRTDNMMATFFALDNRTVVPPFSPIARGEDVTFGLLLCACVPWASIGHLPVALRHAPIEARRFAPREVLSGALAVDLCTVVAAWLSGAAIPRAPEAGLAGVGDRLAALGRMRRDDAAELLRSATLEFVSRRFTALEARAEARSDRPWWQSDVRALLQAWRHASRHRAYHVPVECLRGVSVEAGVDRLIGYFSDVGRLLQWWPEIVRCSIDLRERGQGMADA